MSSSSEVLAPPGTDLEVFRCLPANVQQEVIEEHRRQERRQSGSRRQSHHQHLEPHQDHDPSIKEDDRKPSASMTTPMSHSGLHNIDQDFLDALPDDLKREVLQQQGETQNNRTEATVTNTIESSDAKPISIPIARPIGPSQQYKQVSSNGTTYVGEYNSSGERHGWGTLYFPNGDRYEGGFLNGMRDGEGTLFSDNGSEYIGGWKYNRMHGYGVRHYASGTSYYGEYVNGLRQGRGKTVFSNGDVYEGEYHNDEFEGQGTYLHSKYGECFEGTFLNGNKHGVGKYQMKDGTLDVIRYVENKRVGEGVRYSKDKKKAWILKDAGQKKGRRLSLEEAHSVCQHCMNEATMADENKEKKRGC